MPKGQNPGPGRPKGSPNKATADVRALAQEYTEIAIQNLCSIAVTSSSDQARVAAIRELLDRAHGKPGQALDVHHSGAVAALNAMVDLTDKDPQEAARIYQDIIGG
ncbi:MAG: hypothetical protein ACYDD1_05465 [Caulobacteraceae bacterium]